MCTRCGSPDTSSLQVHRNSHKLRLVILVNEIIRKDLPTCTTVKGTHSLHAVKRFATASSKGEPYHASVSSVNWEIMSLHQSPICAAIQDLLTSEGTDICYREARWSPGACLNCREARWTPGPVSTAEKPNGSKTPACSTETLL